MIRDITLGQYYQTASVIHKLDPRTKLIATLLFVICLFPFTNVYVYIFSGIFLAIMIGLSKVPLRFILRGMKPILMILGVTVFFNMFFTGGEPIFQWWKLTVTREGLRLACFMALRLTYLIIGSSIMTLTTTPNNLTDGMESLMKPLKVFGAPVHELAMMMSIALRFIPILMEETDKIMKAQLARGADFENGNIVKRMKSLIPILIPLFVSAFRRANDLAMAMEARGYRGGQGRTKMKPLSFAKQDYMAFGILAVYLGTVIYLGKFLPKFW